MEVVDDRPLEYASLILPSEQRTEQNLIFF